MSKLLAAILAGVLCVSVYENGGKVEGHYSPGVTQFEIETIRPDGETFSEVTGKFFRPRANCKFHDQNWLSAGGTNAGDIETRGLVERDGGWSNWGPWRLQMTPSQIMGAIITVRHRCTLTVFGRDIPWPWLVETTFTPILDNVEILDG